MSGRVRATAAFSMCVRIRRPFVYGGMVGLFPFALPSLARRGVQNGCGSSAVGGGLSKTIKLLIGICWGVCVFPREYSISFLRISIL